MKKTIILLMAIILSIGVLGIVEIDAEGSDNIGNPYPYDEDRSFNLFTVVGGSTCSSFADYSNSRSFGEGDGYCWNNWAGGSPGQKGVEHDGVVMIMWKSNSAGLQYKVGERELQAGERGCIYAQETGFHYYQAYYCDEKQTRCEEVRPYETVGCDLDACGEGKVLRQRILKEVVSGGCSNWIDKACIDDSLSGFDCSDQKPLIIETPSSGDDSTVDDEDDGGIFGNIFGGLFGGSSKDTNLRGQWQNVAIPSTGKPGEQVVIRARFVALESGRYYLEAGSNELSFSLIADESKCDGSKNWAGEFVDLAKDEHRDVELRPTAHNQEGTYQFILGAYSNCLSKGGIELNAITEAVSISEVVGEKKFTINKEAVFKIVGLVLAIIFIIAIIVFIAKLFKK